MTFFTITGNQIAEAANLNPLIDIIMGIITGVAGGVLRDTLSAEVPLILRKDIYAKAAISGSLIYYLMKFVGLNDITSVIIGIITVFSMRLLAII